MGNASPKYSISTSSRRGAQITIDATMQDDLNELGEKLAEHRRLEKIYAGWVQAFEARPGNTFELDIDDWLFFFGR